MSDAREPFCTCEDWEPCGCGNQPPFHCQWCCHDLSPEQLAAFDFDTFEYIPPRPKGLPRQISSGGITIDNPTLEQMNELFGESRREEREHQDKS